MNGEKPGYPRYKGRGWYDSFCYPQMGFRICDDKIHLGKIGDVYMVKHRPIQGEVKRVCIRRRACKWYVLLTVDAPDMPVNAREVPCIGVDMGLESFATFSNGEKIENPRFFQVEEEAITRAQRKLSKFDKGTREILKARKVVGRIHERIANRRYDFAQQISRKLVNKYGYIVFENLDLDSMVQNRRIAKSIADASWKILIRATQYKAERAGTKVVLVNPAYTSQICSRCGTLVQKGLSDRIHNCPDCGLNIDRDINAAINILRLGLQSAIRKKDKEASCLIIN